MHVLYTSYLKVMKPRKRFWRAAAYLWRVHQHDVLQLAGVLAALIAKTASVALSCRSSGSRRGGRVRLGGGLIAAVEAAGYGDDGVLAGDRDPTCGAR